jgi:hypothetical protein
MGFAMGLSLIDTANPPIFKLKIDAHPLSRGFIQEIDISFW